MKISFETLEPRLTPATTLDAKGLLSVSLDGTGGVHTVAVVAGANPGDVSVIVDGVSKSFRGVTSLDLRGAKNGENYVENDTSLPATLTGVGKRDTLFGGTGNDTLIAGDDNQVLYDLLGTNVVKAKNGNRDFIFKNVQSTVFADKDDQIVTFFAANRTPGAGTIVVEKGVLYLTPPNVASTVTTLDKVKGGYRLTYDWGSGVQTQTFSDLDAIAYFGGSGNDVFTNNTKLSQAAYGGAGNDVLIGGTGKLDVLKGLGGSDVLIGRAKQNDLSNGGSSVSDGSIDVLFASGKFNVFRNGAEDVAVGKGARFNG